MYRFQDGIQVESGQKLHKEQEEKKEVDDLISYSYRTVEKKFDRIVTLLSDKIVSISSSASMDNRRKLPSKSSSISPSSSAKRIKKASGSDTIGRRSDCFTHYHIYPLNKTVEQNRQSWRRVHVHSQKTRNEQEKGIHQPPLGHR